MRQISRDHNQPICHKCRECLHLVFKAHFEITDTFFLRMDHTALPVDLLFEGRVFLLFKKEGKTNPPDVRVIRLGHAADADGLAAGKLRLL